MSNRGLVQRTKIEGSQRPNVPISHCLVPHVRPRVCTDMLNGRWSMAGSMTSYFPPPYEGIHQRHKVLIADLFVKYCIQI